MADPQFVRRETIPETRSGGAITFIVGGLVVAVALIVWVFYANGSFVSSTTTEPAATTNITIDNAAPPVTTPAAPADPVVTPSPSPDPVVTPPAASN